MAHPSRPRARFLRGLPRSRRAAALVALGATAAAAVAVAATAGPGEPEASAACSSQRPLQVIAAPEVAPVLTEVLQVAPWGGDGTTCPKPQVRAEDPADTVATMATDAADRPDVWIPDSSMWTLRPLSAGAGLPADSPSIASSPFVLAVPGTLTPGPGAHRPLSVADLIPSDPDTPVRWVLPDPARSPATVAAVLALRTTTEGRPDGSALLEATVRAADQTSADAASSHAEAGVAKAVPTTEQQVLSGVQDHRDTPRLPVYGPTPSYTADFPFMVLATQRATRLAAAGLLDVLQSDLGRRLFASHGFRDPAGVPGAVLASQAGFESATIPEHGPTAREVASAVSGLQAVRRPTRVLAVVDVSGSMGRTVPGTGGARRLDLALQGLVAGLAAYPDDTVAGLWVFATKMTPTTDYREVVPMVELGRGPDGILGRSRLAEGLVRVTLPKRGRTGLYDTVLAAVREVRREWDPERVSSVVVMTDGADTDRNGIGLSKLLRTLRDEQQTGRPVAVFAIGYGPSADHRALKAIANATGGVAYQPRDPRAIGSLIADAIGRRSAPQDQAAAHPAGS